MALPSNVTTGTVVGRLLDLTGRPYKGRLVFDATPEKLANVTSVPKTVFLPDTESAVIDDEGDIVKELVSTDNEAFNPQDWTWRARFVLTNGKVVSSFHFKLPAGAVVDLADIMPVASSNGVPIIKGEDGIGTDADLASFVEDPASQTRAAISSTHVKVTEGPLMVDRFGAIGNGTVDDTAAINAAILEASRAPQGWGDKSVGLRPGGTYRAGQIKMRSGVALDGFTRSTEIKQAAGTDGPLISLASDTTMLVTVQNLTLNGNVAAQTSPNNAIDLDHTGASAVILPKHLIQNVHVRSFKGDGLRLGTYSRACQVSNVTIYGCDGYGMVLAGADSEITNVDVGSSGLDGVYLAGTAYVVSNVKSWYSGRISNIGDGFSIFGNDHSLSNCYSQENKRHGLMISRAGVNIRGLNITGFTSDSDNTAAGGNNAINIFRLVGSYIQGVVKSTPGLAGAPLSGLGIGSDQTVGNTFDLAITGQASWKVADANLAGNTLRIAGREGRIAAQPYASSLSPNCYEAETYDTTLTGDATIYIGGSRLPAGLSLRFILRQDVTGGRVVTWSSIFKADAGFTPNLGPGKVNIYEFLCTGTHWVQVGGTTY